MSVSYHFNYFPLLLYEFLACKYIYRYTYVRWGMKHNLMHGLFLVKFLLNSSWNILHEKLFCINTVCSNNISTDEQYVIHKSTLNIAIFFYFEHNINTLHDISYDRYYTNILNFPKDFYTHIYGECFLLVLNTWQQIGYLFSSYVFASDDAELVTLVPDDMANTSEYELTFICIRTIK
jgi:hypothetical protein